MAKDLNESTVEDAALAWFESLGYGVLFEPQIAPGEPAAERDDYGEVVLVGRLRDALARLNPTLPPEALDAAFRQVYRPAFPSQLQNNRAFHRMLVDGVRVEYRRPDGEIVGDLARLIDYENPLANDWLVVNQFTIHEGQHTRRPDIVVFVNGLPLAVLELKNAADESATIWHAFQQLQTYKQQIPSLFVYNAMLVISDGVEARLGTLTSNRECMSRRICYDLYNQIIARRPEWHSDDDKQGAVKVIMTGSASDPLEWQPHIRTKTRREALALDFRDPAKPFKIVIVRDMWLTGFDAPCLHTMYLDKPMRGHGLMQAIARVNRVFRDKPGGLVVDYLGLADQLRLALADYIVSGGKGQATLDQDAAIAAMQEKYEVCCDLFHGFEWAEWIGGSPSERLSLLPAAQEHILDQEDGAARLNQAVVELTKALALAMPSDEALRIRDDVAFFQAVRTALIKTTASNRRLSDDVLDHAVRQLVAQAITPDPVTDIFATAGLPKPDISILSDDFLAQVQGMPQRNLAVELLRKLLDDEIRARSRTSLAQSREFSALLERTVRLYQSRTVDTVQVIESLIALAKELRAAERRGEQTGLSSEELAFYEALEVNESAVEVLGDATLKAIARELVEAIRRNVTIDWTVREPLQARMRVIVKRILRKHGYPPDRQEKATLTILQQAELLSETWAV